MPVAERNARVTVARIFTDNYISVRQWVWKIIQKYLSTHLAWMGHLKLANVSYSPRASPLEALRANRRIHLNRDGTGREWFLYPHSSCLHT